MSAKKELSSSSSKSNKGYKNSGGKKNNKGGQQDRNSNKKPPCLSPDDTCPIHGGHKKWGKCFNNKFGENYIPGRAPNRGGGRSNYTVGSNFSTTGHGIMEPLFITFKHVIPTLQITEKKSPLSATSTAIMKPTWQKTIHIMSTPGTIIGKTSGDVTDLIEL